MRCVNWSLEVYIRGGKALRETRGGIVSLGVGFEV